MYVEKPDGHNIVEGQSMVAALRKHERIVQMGNQARSDPGFHAAIEYIRSGKLWSKIFSANPQIKNASMIYVGQTLTVPAK